MAKSPLQARKFSLAAAPIAIAVLWLYAVDTLVRIEVGPASVSGFLTVLAAALAVVATWTRQVQSSEVVRGFSVIASVFVILAWARLALTPSIDGLQNVSVYTAFFAVVLVAATRTQEQQTARIYRWLGMATWIVPLAFMVGIAIGVPIYGNRSYAAVALVLISISFATPARSLLARTMPLVIAATIVMSSSRTASVIALVLLLLAVARFRRSARGLIAIATATVIGVIGYLTITFYTPLRERFSGGDNAIVGGLQINTSGRQAFWEEVWNSALQAPWIGKGPGSAGDLVGSKWGEVGHPHNDFLRIFHDFGAIGFILFVSALLIVVASLIRTIRRTDSTHAWTALGALLAVSALAVTDNVLVYPFVMMPLGLLCGLALRRSPSFAYTTLQTHLREDGSTNGATPSTKSSWRI